jgi:hypothetical protein
MRWTIAAVRSQFILSTLLIAWWAVFVVVEESLPGWEVGPAVTVVTFVCGLPIGLIGLRARLVAAAVHGVISTTAGVIVALWIYRPHSLKAIGSFDDVLALAMVFAVPLSAYVVASHGPRARPASSTRTALADAIGLCLVRQDAYRFGIRAWRRLYDILWPPIFYGLMVATPFTALAFANTDTVGPWRVFGAAALIVGVYWGMLRLREYLENPPVRSTDEHDSEQALIQLLQTGQPFGIYLRPFDRPGGVADVLATFGGVPFFAIDDVRPTSHAVGEVPRIWIPARHWKDIVLPLLAHAAVSVIELPADGALRKYRGLAAELRFAVEHGLTPRVVLVLSGKLQLRLHEVELLNAFPNFVWQYQSRMLRARIGAVLGGAGDMSV